MKLMPCSSGFYRDRTLAAFRRNITFPGLMFELGLASHREKKLLIKIECEPHHYNYKPDKPIIQKFNVFTQVFAPSPDILLSMKTGAVLERGKGRDYYDFVFLSGITDPNFDYLESKFGITNQTRLLEKILDAIEKTNRPEAAPSGWLAHHSFTLCSSRKVCRHESPLFASDENTATRLV